MDALSNSSLPKKCFQRNHERVKKKKKVLVALKPTSEVSFFVSLSVESEKHEEIRTSTSHFTASKIEMGHLVLYEFTKQQESQEHLMLNLCAIHCE